MINRFQLCFNFAFNFNLRRYKAEEEADEDGVKEAEAVEEAKAEEEAAGAPDLGTGTKQRRGSREIASHYASALGNTVGSTYTHFKQKLTPLATGLTGHLQPANQRLTAGRCRFEGRETHVESVWFLSFSS